MGYSLTEYSESHAAGAMAFNQRMRAAGGDTDAGFLLPERPLACGTRFRQYVVTDEDHVRGGCLLEMRPHWLAGGEAEVWNIQSPLSEGLIDRTHANVALFMMKSLLRQNPRMYGVGMGSQTRPFPRLVKALGWTVTPAPFFFRVLRGNRFLREVRILRTPSWRRWTAQLSAGLRIGAVGFQLLHWRPTVAGGAAVEAVEQFSASADALWRDQREQWAFASNRGAAALNQIYGAGFAGQRWQLGDGAGWAVTTLADFQDHHHFGALRVGAIADLIARPGRQALLIEQVVAQLRAAGADLVVSNQMDPAYQAAFRARGFLTGPSNFLFAASKTLAATIGSGRIQLNRGDGDGLVNLG